VSGRKEWGLDGKVVGGRRVGQRELRGRESGRMGVGMSWQGVGV